MNPVTDHSQIALFDLADRRLAWIAQRQSLLAQNIANANTPGWRSRDVAPFARQLASAGTALTQTDPAHLPGLPSVDAQSTSKPGELAPDQNGVSVEAELAKVADTQTTNSLVEDIYKKYLSFFKTAIGR
jgi:flagellar basal-body rod protein FlgB